MVARRLMLQSAGGGALALLLGRTGLPAAQAAEPSTVTRTEAEWRSRLTPAQYAILRENGTERSFSSRLVAEHRSGIFACVGCERPLFSSATKFDSDSGWPAFSSPLADAVAPKEDRSLGLVRTAVSCRGCDGHVGHIFGDGPPPTGLRYCINGAILEFRPGAA